MRESAVHAHRRRSRSGAPPRRFRSSSIAMWWTFGDDGLVAESQGHYDQAEYDRQLEHGTAERQ